ncbi:phosphoribosylanthranilate isomerase [Mangrovimonas sp. DI 80]|uniref:phosphoribosylanthranilate isomerase n=1 Tax=Mangrovimonas sp. DI 80 TaxID=1779330 RepID=UPI000977DEF4|nr:phosphoribosylanthranilate isomerase [Mangrovimonas sp. DI 80]OMP30200.1 N-(5'-phosphoribosyl)anthranilate isomerase [Mangrovimonas sp. DI 80]
MKLKVCGMKYSDNIKAVAALKPDYLGFIFYEGSSRFFKGTIPEISDAIKKTGVFVNASIQEVIKKVTDYGLKAVQLHGAESVTFIDGLKKELNKISDSSVEIIKVFSVDRNFNFDNIKPFETMSDYFLFDTKGDLPGGNGELFNWKVLESYPSAKPYILSGGIGPTDVPILKRFLKSSAAKYCYAIDVNSRFEITAGHKNVNELENFINELQRQ